MRIIVALAAFALVSCAQAREAAKAHSDPTKILLDAVAACNLYRMAPEGAPKNADLDKMCEALLDNCQGD